MCSFRSDACMLVNNVSCICSAASFSWSLTAQIELLCIHQAARNGLLGDRRLLPAKPLVAA